MNEDRTLLRKLLREHYETAVAGGEFDLEAVTARAMADPGIAALEQAIHAEACRSGIRGIDVALIERAPKGSFIDRTFRFFVAPA